MTMRAWRVVIVSALAVAAAIGPALTGGADRVDAQCLATFGSRNDGICLDGPSAPAPDFPSFGVGPTDGSGPGLSTSPLFPGQHPGPLRWAAVEAGKWGTRSSGTP